MTSSVLKCLWSAEQAVKNIGESPQNADGTIKGEDTDERVTKVPRTAMDVVGVVGFASAATTMALTEGHVVTTACLSTMAYSPLVAYQKRTLKDLGGMRGQQNQLRASVNTLSQQNSILSGSVDKLAEQVDKLEHVEEQLNGIAEAARTNVNRLVDICSETAELQAKIKRNLERQVIQNVLTVVVQSDANRDFCLGPNEMNMLVIRLKATPGIDFDEANFKKAVGQGKVTLTNIMNVLRNLLDDDVPEEENIFHLKPDAILEEKK